MNNNKKKVLFIGLGVIILAVIAITATSLIKYAIYRSQAEEKAATQIEFVI